MQKMIFAIDTHTQGQSTRVIFGGLPPIPGKSMTEKKNYFHCNLDHLRCSILLEPRGHNDMFGAVITEPTHPKAQMGVFFMDTGGYLNMCGHGIIGTVTAAVELGILSLDGESDEVIVETPIGLVPCWVTVKGDKVASVSFNNLPSFLYQKNVQLRIKEHVLRQSMGLNGAMNTKDDYIFEVDIAFGGSFFVLVPADDYGIELDPQNASNLITLGMAIKEAANIQIAVQHPEMEHINTIDLVEFSREPQNALEVYKNAVVFGKGQLDRSPCGTGTCAKMAALHSKGLLQIGEHFWHESILGTRFRGEITALTKVGDYPAIVPRITSSSYTCGYHQLVLDEADPLVGGFLLK
jgi:proline racemase